MTDEEIKLPYEHSGHVMSSDILSVFPRWQIICYLCGVKSGTGMTLDEDNK